MPRGPLSKTTQLYRAAPAGAPVVGGVAQLNDVAQTHAVLFSWSTGTGVKPVTAITMSLEGSLNSINWDTLGTHAATSEQLNNREGLFFVVDKPVSHVRIRISHLVHGAGDTNPMIYIQHLYK